MITFTNKKYNETITYPSQPVFYIDKINFSTQEKNWATRLDTANLTIKISCIVSEDRELVSSNQEYLSLGAHINLYQKQPVLEANKYFRFPKELILQNYTKWKVDITLNNLTLKEGEFLSIESMDSEYVRKRVDDWADRVHNLIQNMRDWAETKNNIELKLSRRQKMHEGLMKEFGIPMKEIESADIFKNGEITVVVKPYGLWIIGANGRIDFLTAKRNFVLIDEAEKFQTPQWKLFLKNERSQGVSFNKERFFQIIGA